MPRKPSTIRRMQDALKANDVEAMRRAIADGADLDRKDKDGYPYLIKALLWDRYGVAKLLIESGADVNLRGRNNTTAIGMAVTFGRRDLMRMLIDRGADVNMAEASANGGITPLHRACLADLKHKKPYAEDVRAIMVSILLDAGADPNARDAFGDTSLYYACNQGHLKTVRLLLSRGAEVNMGNNHNESPFDAVMELKDDNPAREDLIEVFREYAPDIVFSTFCTMHAAPGGM